MRFYTIEKDGALVPVVSADGGRTGYDIRALGLDAADIAALIRENAAENVRILKEALGRIHGAGANEEASGAIFLDSATLRAPIVFPDQDMICLGINYRDHAEESARFSEDAFGGERPYTIYFSKRVSRATGSGETIPAYEELVDGLDYEVELGVVLGKTVKNVTEEEAMDSIFGYTVINDVSARNLQTRHKQWYLGKSLDGFSPMGPCIVTPEELGDPENLEISCFVNDELRQKSNTGLMIQSIAGAIAELSRGMTLNAGTIIATGTPSGVGMGFEPPRFLKKGDKVSCRIQGIGKLVNYVK